MSLQVNHYLEDQKVDDIKKAAVMADDFELTHQRAVNKGIKPGFKPQAGMGVGKSFPKPSGGLGSSKPDVERQGRVRQEALVCYYCGKKGHKKNECWALENKNKMKGTSPKPSLLVSEKVKSSEWENSSALDLYKGFLSGGVVSIAGNDYPVVILRDTVAAQSLWVVNGITLPPSSSLKVCALIQGVNSDISEFKSVPLHQVYLRSPLVTGLVKVGVVSSLPLPGVTFVLGNDLAGEKVCVAPLILDAPIESSEMDALQNEFPRAFPTCVVTRSQAKMNQEEQTEKVRDQGGPEVILAETFFVEHALDEQTFSKEDLIKAQ